MFKSVLVRWQPRVGGGYIYQREGKDDYWSLYNKGPVGNGKGGTCGNKEKCTVKTCKDTCTCQWGFTKIEL
jgi:hypothetical protein